MRQSNTRTTWLTDWFADVFIYIMKVTDPKTSRLPNGTGLSSSMKSETVPTTLCRFPLITYVENLVEGNVMKKKKASEIEIAETDSMVESPLHYRQGEIEAINAIEAALSADEFRGYLKGNVMKYLWREAHKGGSEDVRKAQWYLNRLVDLDA